jgi:hypothetical protein
MTSGCKTGEYFDSEIYRTELHHKEFVFIISEIKRKLILELGNTVKYWCKTSSHNGRSVENVFHFTNLCTISYNSINLPLYVFRLVNPQGVTVLKHRLYIYYIICYIHVSKTLKH